MFRHLPTRRIKNGDRTNTNCLFREKTSLKKLLETYIFRRTDVCGRLVIKTYFSRFTLLQRNAIKPPVYNNVKTRVAPLTVKSNWKSVLNIRRDFEANTVERSRTCSKKGDLLRAEILFF